MSLGNNDEGIPSFDESIRLNPNDAMTWYQKGLSLNLLGKKKEAMQIYEIDRLIKIRSQNQNPQSISSFKS
ncbi:MAG TPA: tetratricopeptide repeat protein [Candidatus Nitrosocosmicus sp.]|nr:tetratricopeptide repeat protein [Candidatus Nitrosocosmicus sp.]